jgi:inner membrane protein
MLIAHLPASYLWTRFAQRRLDTRWLLPLGLLAGLLPDVDLFYFYLVDGRQHLHHSCWTHLPVSWALLASLAAVLVLWERRLCDAVRVFLSNILLHLALDTVAGGICWLYPLSARSVQLVSIPAVHGHWLLDFVLHWSFALEIAIVVVALCAWLRDRSAGARARGQRPRSASTRPRDSASRVAVTPAPGSQVRSSMDLTIFKVENRGRTR